MEEERDLNASAEKRLRNHTRKGRLAVVSNPFGLGRVGASSFRLFVVIIACSSLLAAMPGNASAATTHPFLSSFSGLETSSGSFGGLGGVAVNESSHEIYLTDEVGGPAFSSSIDVYSATGVLIEQISGAETPQGSLNGVTAVAVDNTSGPASGDIYVLDREHQEIDQFSSSGHYLRQFSPPGTPNIASLAVDPDGTVYAGNLAGVEVDRFTSTGTQLPSLPSISATSLAAPTPEDLYANLNNERVSKFVGGNLDRAFDSETPVAVAVEAATGDVYVAHGTFITEYAEDGSFISRFGPTALTGATGIAVDSSTGDIYVADRGSERTEIFGPAAVAPTVTSKPASAVGQTDATLNGTINPESEILPATYQFEYGITSEYEQVAPDVPAVVGTGTTSQSVVQELTGLEPNATYHYRLVGFDANGRVEGQDESFTTSGPPSIANEQARAVGTTEATLSAEIDPNGENTSYYFAYGAGGETIKAPASPAELGSGHNSREVRIRIGGLLPGTDYHFHVVATSGAGTEAGPEESFTTYPSPEARGRNYELVSDNDKEGGEIYSVGDFSTPGIPSPVRQPFQSAEDGNSVVYAGDPTSGGNGVLGNEYRAVRDEDGWQVTDLSVRTPGPSSTCPEVPTTTAPYGAFSTDLQHEVFYAVPTPALAALTGAPECYDTPFLSSPGGDYRALITTKPPIRLPGEFGLGKEAGEPALAQMYAGADEDFTRLFFTANDALLHSASTVSRQENNLYELDTLTGETKLVNVLPNGQVEQNASIGAPSSETEAPPNTEHAISNNGRVVFWSALTGTRRLYARIDGDRTVQVDAPRGGSGEGGTGTFLAASADGNKVIFKAEAPARLTPTTTGFGENLYEFSVASEELVDLTPEPTYIAVKGVVATSENTGYVYFVAEGVLGDGATSVPPAVEGEPNLYLSHEGRLHFIATLTEQDNANGQEQPVVAEVGDWRGGLAYSTARATADGRYLVFQSREALLPGYQNRGQTEVYLYDADSASLKCVSCNPTGAPAKAPSLLHISGVGSEQPRWVTDAGGVVRVFFDSQEALVNADTNGTWDVYEYSAGRTRLVSDGEDRSGSWFDDASPDGKNVFFTTRARLVSEDQDELADLYDARIGGGFAARPVPAVCGSESECRSVTVSGFGSSEPSAGSRELEGTEKRRHGKRPRLGFHLTSRGHQLTARVDSSIKGTVALRGSMIVAARSVQTEPGRTAVASLRLTGAARARLANGHPLRVRVVATLQSPGARSISSSRTVVVK